MLEEDELAIIQRNDLAEHFNCVPSQINYVLSTRFTPTQGILCRKFKRWEADV